MCSPVDLVGPGANHVNDYASRPLDIAEYLELLFVSVLVRVICMKCFAVPL